MLLKSHINHKFIDLYPSQFHPQFFLQQNNHKQLIHIIIQYTIEIESKMRPKSNQITFRQRKTCICCRHVMKKKRVLSLLIQLEPQNRKIEKNIQESNFIYLDFCNNPRFALVFSTMLICLDRTIFLLLFL